MSTAVVTDPILVLQAAAKLTGTDKTLLNKTTAIPCPDSRLLDPVICDQTLSNNQWAKRFCRDAAYDAKRWKDNAPTYHMKGVWLKDFIWGPKNTVTAKGMAESLGGLFCPKACWAFSKIDQAAQEGETVYFDGIKDSVLAKTTVATKTLHHIDVHKSPRDGHHDKEDHLLQYIKVDSTKDSEDLREDGICRSFIYVGAEYVYEDRTFASERTSTRHLVHAWPDQGSDPTVELAILLGEMFWVSFPAFYTKYEAAFLAGCWYAAESAQILLCPPQNKKVYFIIVMLISTQAYMKQVN
ncbi:hypothetical protein BDR06DRAFT_969864 [Suillus hirtellus]|nr:hypothetical protein BDR06DRAFT_969864 [Suillus hirtellus]